MKKIGIILHDEVINNKTYKILNTDFIKYLSNYDVVIIGIIYDEETFFRLSGGDSAGGM